MSAEIPQTMAQAKIYSAFLNMRLKRTVTLVILWVWVALVAFLVVALSIPLKTESNIILASFESVLTPTMYVMCKHYFSAKNLADTFGD